MSDLLNIIDLLKSNNSNIPLVIIPSFVEEAYVDKKPQLSDMAIYLSWKMILEETPEYIMSTIAHEIGHFKKKYFGFSVINHVDTSTFISTTLAFLILQFMFTIMDLPQFILLIMWSIWVLTLIPFLLLMLSVSREGEYEADKTAVRLGHGEYLLFEGDRPMSRLAEILSTHPCPVKRRNKIIELMKGSDQIE